MADKLTIALLAFLYGATGDTFLPAWGFYIIAGANLLVFFALLHKKVINNVLL